MNVIELSYPNNILNQIEKINYLKPRENSSDFNIDNFSFDLLETQNYEINNFLPIIAKPIPLYFNKPLKFNNFSPNIFDKKQNFSNNSIFSIFSLIGKKRKRNSEKYIDERNKQDVNISTDFSNFSSAFKKYENKSVFSLNSEYNINNNDKLKNTNLKTNYKKQTVNIIIKDESSFKDNLIKKQNLFKLISFTEKNNDNDKNIINDINQNSESTKDTNSIEQYPKRRRGRKPLNPLKTKRIHDATDYDNIIRKIQVHFLTFLVSFANDLVEAFLPNHKELRFKNCDYNLKKTVRHSYVEELKKNTFGSILQFQASPKNRNCEEIFNRKIYNNVCLLSSELQNFFNKSYLDLFVDYYYQKNRSLSINDVNVKLSPKTKLFADLLEKNLNVSEKIKEIAIKNYIEIHKKNKNKLPIFVIKK